MRQATRPSAGFVAAIVILFSAAAAHAQTAGASRVDLTLQVGFGGDVGESTSPQAGAAAIALGYRLSAWSLQVQGEMLGLTQACADGPVDGCRYPSGGLFGVGAGVRRSFPAWERVVPYLGAGGGLYLWTGGSSDPGASVDLGVAVPTRGRISLEAGARWRTIFRDPSFSVLTGQLGVRVAMRQP